MSHKTEISPGLSARVAGIDLAAVMEGAGRCLTTHNIVTRDKELRYIANLIGRTDVGQVGLVKPQLRL